MICPNCGYNTFDNQLDTCPNCGTPLTISPSIMTNIPDDDFDNDLRVDNRQSSKFTPQANLEDDFDVETKPQSGLKSLDKIKRKDGIKERYKQQHSTQSEIQEQPTIQNPQQDFNQNGGMFGFSNQAIDNQPTVDTPVDVPIQPDTQFAPTYPNQQFSMENGMQNEIPNQNDEFIQPFTPQPNVDSSFDERFSDISEQENLQAQDNPNFVDTNQNGQYFGEQMPNNQNENIDGFQNQDFSFVPNQQPMQDYGQINNMQPNGYGMQPPFENGQAGGNGFDMQPNNQNINMMNGMQQEQPFIPEQNDSFNNMGYNSRAFSFDQNGFGNGQNQQIPQQGFMFPNPQTMQPNNFGNQPQNFGNGFQFDNVAQNNQPMQNGFGNNDVSFPVGQVDYNKLDKFKEKKPVGKIVAIILLVITMIGALGGIIYAYLKQQGLIGGYTPIDVRQEVTITPEPTPEVTPTPEVEVEPEVTPTPEVEPEPEIKETDVFFTQFSDLSNYKMIGANNIGYMLVPVDMTMENITDTAVRYKSSDNVNTITIKVINKTEGDDITNKAYELSSQLASSIDNIQVSSGVFDGREFAQISGYYTSKDIYITAFLFAYQDIPDKYYWLSAEYSSDNVQTYGNSLNMFTPQLTGGIPIELSNESDYFN